MHAFKFDAFQHALPILATLEEAGHEAYFVGGCIRDALLKREINDIDIATSAYPQEVQALFPRHFDVGLEHGTVMVLHENVTYEITTFRTESEYQDYRRPDHVTFVKNLSEDLLRRDFTMNALAMNQSGEIIDYFGGQDDIKAKRIVAVGNANERFNEDALRMMRAVRFAAQLDFEIAEETLQGIQANAHLLEKIAIERVLVEMEKLWQALHWQKALRIFYDKELYLYTPHMKTLDGAIKQMIVSCDGASVFSDLSLAWAILLWLDPSGSVPSSAFTKAWKMSNQSKKDIATYISLLDYRKQHEHYETWDLYQASFNAIRHLEHFIQQEQMHQTAFGQQFTPLSIETLEHQYAQLPIHQLKELAVNGKDIIATFQPSQKAWVGEALRYAEKQVVMGTIENNKEAIIRLLTMWKE